MMWRGLKTCQGLLTRIQDHSAVARGEGWTLRDERAGLGTEAPQQGCMNTLRMGQSRAGAMRGTRAPGGWSTGRWGGDPATPPGCLPSLDELIQLRCVLVVHTLKGNRPCCSEA